MVLLAHAGDCCDLLLPYPKAIAWAEGKQLKLPPELGSSPAGHGSPRTPHPPSTQGSLVEGSPSRANRVRQQHAGGGGGLRVSTIAAQQEAAVARGDFAEAARLKPLVAKLQALEGYKHAAVSAHFYEEAAEWQASLGAWAGRDDAARWAAADAAHDAARRGRAVAAGLGGGGATGAIVQLDGATGPMAHVLNGTYDLWEASDDGSPAFVAPAFLKRGSFRRGGKPGARAVWLYLATNKRGAKLWFVSNTKHKDARKNIGFAYNSVPINTAASAVGGAPPLPHQSALGCWKVAVGGGKQGYAVQPPIASAPSPGRRPTRPRQAPLPRGTRLRPAAGTRPRP